MIDKLYKLKQQQINQQLLQKQTIMHSIADKEKEIQETNQRLHSVTLDVMGAISDFRVLEIHKETMKDHIIKLSKEKEQLQKEVEKFDQVIVSLNKESEQFHYLLQEEKKKHIKKIQKKKKRLQQNICKQNLLQVEE